MATAIWYIQIPIFGILGYLFASELCPKRFRMIFSAVLFASVLLMIWFLDIEPPWEISTIRESGARLPSWAVFIGWALRWLAFGSVGALCKMQ